eukprot:434746_1
MCCPITFILFMEGKMIPTLSAQTFILVNITQSIDTQIHHTINHTDSTYKARAHIDEEYVQNDTAGDGSLFTWTDGLLLKRFKTTRELDEYIRDGNLCLLMVYIAPR